MLKVLRGDTAMPDVPLPFNADDCSFNRVNALYLAHALDVAYHRAPARQSSAPWYRCSKKFVPLREYAQDDDLRRCSILEETQLSELDATRECSESFDAICFT